jgi:hypothetical protein
MRFILTSVYLMVGEQLFNPYFTEPLNRTPRQLHLLPGPRADGNTATSHILTCFKTLFPILPPLILKFLNPFETRCHIHNWHIRKDLLAQSPLLQDERTDD